MIVKVSVRPNSAEEKVERVADREYKISIREPARDNKANIRVINLLSREFNTSYKNIKIKNPTSREKIVEIRE